MRNDPVLPSPYWRAVRRLTGGLLVFWFVVTFVVSAFARELQGITILGFPLPFYMGAQGTLLAYVLLVGFYAWQMQRLDRESGGAQEDA